MSKIDNIILQVRSRLQSEGIKLWEEPFYFDDIGSMEVEIDRLATDFSENLGISVSMCKAALSELQDGALRKLAARKEFAETGQATLHVRSVNNQEGTSRILEIKCPLSALGSELRKRIADSLGREGEASQVKCISAGRMIDPEKTLEAQGLKNNQQIMVIISQVDQAKSSSSTAKMYDRIEKIKRDVEAIVDSSQQLFEMEDQDGNPVFLPPDENRALLIAMGFCEKARAALNRQQYDEALILLLEADERFVTCNSKFLESVDNYGLVNLDIVWCYLCLKNVTQLPDAQRRLEICEKSFRRSYGENLDRLIALKGNACPERALIMRLHLLQGVVYFHQNRRNEAYERLEMASTELLELKVDDTSVESLVEMGYEPFEARLGLRACGGNIERAINFIHERREKLQDTRKRSEKERRLNKQLTHRNNADKDWVNPRSVCTLVEMGYAHELVVEALRRTKNDVPRALDLIQSNADELRRTLRPTQEADGNLLEQLVQLGFTAQIARAALETTRNNLDNAITFLIETFASDEELARTIERLAVTAAMTAMDNTASTSTSAAAAAAAAASTSTAASTSAAAPVNMQIIDTIMQKAKREMETWKAYKRFNADLTVNDQDYLDLPLVQEEQILAEYKRFLEQ